MISREEIGIIFENDNGFIRTEIEPFVVIKSDVIAP